jgi:hypothetical protein
VETFRQNKKKDTLAKQKKEPMGVWKRKEKEKEEEEYILVQIVLHVQNKGNRWYIDSGCSSHVTWDKNKFHTLNEVNEGSITFGDNATTRIAGRGTLSLDNGKTKIDNVLYVEYLEHNLLNVSQMCDQ